MQTKRGVAVHLPRQRRSVPAQPPHQRRRGGLVVLGLHGVLVKDAGEGVGLAAVAALVCLGALGRCDGDAVPAGGMDAVLGVPAGRTRRHAGPDAHKHLRWGRRRGRGGGSGSSAGTWPGAATHVLCCVQTPVPNAPGWPGGVAGRSSASNSTPRHTHCTPTHLQLLQLQLVVQPRARKRVRARQARLPRVLLGLGALWVLRKQVGQAPAQVQPPRWGLAGRRQSAHAVYTSCCCCCCCWVHSLPLKSAKAPPPAASAASHWAQLLRDAGRPQLLHRRLQLVCRRHRRRRAACPGLLRPARRVLGWRAAHRGIRVRPLGPEAAEGGRKGCGTRQQPTGGRSWARPGTWHALFDVRAV